MTKHEKMLKKRMENIDNYVIPSNEFNLPSIPEGGAAAFTFSLSDGIKIRVSFMKYPDCDVSVEEYVWFPVSSCSEH